MSHWTAHTTYVSLNDGDRKVSPLTIPGKEYTQQEATDLAGRYVLTLCTSAKEQGGANVQPVGRFDWRVTFPDGYAEDVYLLENPA